MAHDRYFEKKEFKDKLNQYENARKQEKFVYLESDDLTDIAEYYEANGNVDQATETLSYALSIFPGATQPLVFRARIALVYAKDIALADSFAEQITDKQDLSYHYIKAEIMIADGREEDANAYLHEKLETIDNEDRPDFVLDVSTLFADYSLMEKAQEWLELSDEPELADYKELQGRIAFGNGNYEESEHIYNQLLDEYPYSNHYWNSLASVQYTHSRINDSIESSEFSIAIDPEDDEAILNKANGLFALGNYEEALKYYIRYSTLRPKEVIGYLFQGNAYMNMEKFGEAMDAYTKALAIAKDNSPQLIEIYQELAFTESRLDHLDKALYYVDKAYELAESEKNELLILKGYLLLEHDLTKEAYSCFLKAMAASRNSASIVLRIAVCFYDCGHLKTAYRIFKYLLHTDKRENEDEGYAYMAACCKMMEKQDEYLEYLKTACERNPHEARMVFSDSFPPGIDPIDYYDYASKHTI
ncbi:MAG: tetratricopeptide repeat protein [Prevotella sp.]